MQTEDALHANGNIPTERTKLIPDARPKRVRNTATASYNKRREKRQRNRFPANQKLGIYLINSQRKTITILKYEIDKLHIFLLRNRNCRRKSA